MALKIHFLPPPSHNGDYPAASTLVSTCRKAKNGPSVKRKGMGKKIESRNKEQSKNHGNMPSPIESRNKEQGTKQEPWGEHANTKSRGS
jgi:hypothetical protein